MKTPKIAAYKSIKLELEPGVYYYCTCGESNNQPFCDGSHNIDIVSGEQSADNQSTLDYSQVRKECFQPLEFTITEKKVYSLCPCKHTEKAPFCDGSHKKLCQPE